MLIRNQDKTVIANLENLNAVWVDHEKESEIWKIAGPLGKSKIIFGEYSSNANAIKVLDEICNQYGRYTCRYGSDHSIDAVYQMPQDSEVE
jgi:hypothetical protein